VSRHRDPSEWTPAFGEQGADVPRDKPLERERVGDAGLTRLSADVVPVIEDHASGPEEIEHGPDVNRNRLAGPLQIFLRIASPKLGRGFDGQTLWNIAAKRIVRACLVRHHVRSDPPPYEFGMDLRALADQADRERRHPRFRTKGRLAVIWPSSVRPSASSAWNVSQFDHFGTRCAFAMRTRGASRWVLKTATGLPLCTIRVSSSRRLWSESTMRWNASQLRAALPVPP